MLSKLKAEVFEEYKAAKTDKARKAAEAKWEQLLKLQNEKG